MLLFFAFALVRVLMNQVYAVLHNCIYSENSPPIPVRGDTNRGGEA